MCTTHMYWSRERKKNLYMCSPLYNHIDEIRNGAITSAADGVLFSAASSSSVACTVRPLPVCFFFCYCCHLCSVCYGANEIFSVDIGPMGIAGKNIQRYKEKMLSTWSLRFNENDEKKNSSIRNRSYESQFNTHSIAPKSKRFKCKFPNKFPEFLYENTW